MFSVVSGRYGYSSITVSSLDYTVYNMNKGLNLYLNSYLAEPPCDLQDKSGFRVFKVEYHANENRLKKSNKSSISWSKINISNNKKKTLLH